MRQNKSFFSLILLALIIFCQGFQSIEGIRYLKSDEIMQHKMHIGIFSTTDAAAITDLSPPTPPTEAVGGSPPAPGHDVDNFRPTAPGHSPGVGHSVHN
ncbi:precursor of CEP3-like [Abrus precatorius]|uniref:Precursor of CEP3-like n=1 Tax=Abrus precatorius TaxID=3816 RepID=A0A8B8M1W4_ABRPR|nr:precursor of CEP3-like [Abrus precatorius]